MSEYVRGLDCLFIWEINHKSIAERSLIGNSVKWKIPIPAQWLAASRKAAFLFFHPRIGEMRWVNQFIFTDS